MLQILNKFPYSRFLLRLILNYNMKWCVKENRVSKVAHSGYGDVGNFQDTSLTTNHIFVYSTIDMYIKTYPVKKPNC